MYPDTSQAPPPVSCHLPSPSHVFCHPVDSPSGPQVSFSHRPSLLSSHRHLTSNPGFVKKGALVTLGSASLSTEDLDTVHPFYILRGVGQESTLDSDLFSQESSLRHGISSLESAVLSHIHSGCSPFGNRMATLTVCPDPAQLLPWGRSSNPLYS